MQIPRRQTRPVRSRALPAVVAALGALLAPALLAPPAGAAPARPSSGPAVMLGGGGVRLAAPRSQRAARHHRRHPAAPAVTRDPHSLYAQPGAFAQFSAAASGSPAPKVRWQVSRDAGASWRYIAGAHGRTFTFMAVVAQDGDQFRAVFKNRRGSATTDAATLTVAAGYQAPVIEQQPASETVANGADATFVAVAEGDPQPSVQWQISDNGGESWSDVEGATQPTLSFLASTILDGDQFRALFSNSLGSVLSATATLTVAGSGGAPYVTAEPQDTYIAAPGPVSFTAEAGGSPAPSVQWQVSTDSGASWTNIAGATATTYSFDATAGENLDEYQAVFSNSEGSTVSDPAILGVGYELSSNWSGYVATGGIYDFIRASWTVPAVSCTAGANSYSSQWVGLDGVSDETVEQDGTYSDCDGATPVYGAWYEMVGDDSVNNGEQTDVPVGDAVHPGDSITATVAVSGGDSWLLTIDDTTRSWIFNEPITWSGAQQTSAEWIVERPTLCDESGDCALAPLADFDATTFTNATADAGGGQQSIAALDGVPVDMIRSGTDSTLLAGPGPLDGSGEIFSVTWQNGS